jgi:hypothetical protein
MQIPAGAILVLRRVRALPRMNAHVGDSVQDGSVITEAAAGRILVVVRVASVPHLVRAEVLARRTYGFVACARCDLHANLYRISHVVILA